MKNIKTHIQDLRASASEQLASTVRSLKNYEMAQRKYQNVLQEDLEEGQAQLEKESHSFNSSLTPNTESKLFEVLALQNKLAVQTWDHQSWAELYSDSMREAAQHSEMLRVGYIADQFQGAALLPSPAYSNLTLFGSVTWGAEVIKTLLVRMLAERGGVQVTIIDPDNNGSTLSSFGKADTNQGGVFKPTVTKASDITETLQDLSDRVASISQNFLQGKTLDIHEYNAKASIPETLHVVIAVSPETYSAESINSLERLARTGLPCGVSVVRLITRGRDLLTPNKAARDAYSHVEADLIEGQKNRFDLLPYGSGINMGAPIKLDPAPTSNLIEQVITLSEARHKKALKPLGLRGLLSNQWSPVGAVLSAPVGVSGTNPFNLTLGVSGAHPHLLIAGRTGAGKSSFLHSAILALASKYSPDDLHFYLVDAKQGVEMSNYVPGAKSLSAGVHLPHVKIAAVKSDIRTYISVLEKIRAEIRERGRVCSRNGVSNVVELAEKYPEKKMARIVVVLDEFHVLLTDPQFGLAASTLLKDVAKQARAYGIHLILATQSLGNMGARGENAALFEQLGNRIALSCEANVSEMVLGAGNTAASKLTRVGEAIFTPAAGAPEHNVPFQVAYVDPTDERPELITELHRKAGTLEKPFVFAGDSLAEITESPIMDAKPSERSDTEIWLGNPVRISGPVSTRLDSFKGGNLLILGVGDDENTEVSGTLAAAALSAFKAHPDAKFIIVGAHRDDPRYDQMVTLTSFLNSVGADVELLEPGRRAEHRLDEITAQVKASAEADPETGAQTFLIVADGDGSIPSAKLGVIAELGATVGVHLMINVSTKRSLAATLGVNVVDKALNFFDSRVYALLNSNEASASALGLPERPANEEERFTLWEASRPNKVEVFIPFRFPEDPLGQAGDWEKIRNSFGGAK